MDDTPDTGRIFAQIPIHARQIGPVLHFGDSFSVRRSRCPPLARCCANHPRDFAHSPPATPADPSGSSPPPPVGSSRACKSSSSSDRVADSLCTCRCHTRLQKVCREAVAKGVARDALANLCPPAREIRHDPGRTHQRATAVRARVRPAAPPPRETQIERSICARRRDACANASGTGAYPPPGEIVSPTRVHPASCSATGSARRGSITTRSFVPLPSRTII